MKRNLYIAIIALTLIFGVAAHAQDASSYELAGTVTASGAAVEGGDYAMNGVLGQTGIGTVSGGDYALEGGFFSAGGGTGGTTINVYLPIVRR